MKKLMAALGVVVMAAAAQAVTVNWADSKALYNGTLSNDKIAEGTAAYLIQASAHSATDIVSGWVAKTLTAATIQGYAIDVGSLDDSRMAGKVGGECTALTAGLLESTYYVVFNGDNMFVSAVNPAAGYDDVTKAYTFEFSTSTTLSKAKPVSTAYAGAGWYTAVPEPTSGLMLILGIGLMALKRKRA